LIDSHLLALGKFPCDKDTFVSARYTHIPEGAAAAAIWYCCW